MEVLEQRIEKAGPIVPASARKPPGRKIVEHVHSQKRKRSLEESNEQPRVKLSKDVMSGWWKENVSSRNVNIENQKVQNPESDTLKKKICQNQNQENLVLPRRPFKGGKLRNLTPKKQKLQTTLN